MPILHIHIYLNLILHYYGNKILEVVYETIYRIIIFFISYLKVQMPDSSHQSYQTAHRALALTSTAQTVTLTCQIVTAIQTRPPIGITIGEIKTLQFILAHVLHSSKAF